MKMKTNNSTTTLPRLHVSGGTVAWLGAVALLVVLLIAASCSEVETVGQQREIGIEALTDVATKAPITGTTFPTTRPISLSAWLYNPNSSTYSERWFSGVNYAYSSTDTKWHATPPKYWPMQGGLRFAGLSKVTLAGTVTFPWTDDNATNRAKAVIQYVMPDNSTIQDDVLYCGLTAYSQDYTTAVPMVFKHAQGQVAFTAKSNIAYDATNNIGIEITGITLKSMNYSGTMTVNQAGAISWASLGTAKTLAVPGISSFKAGATSAALGTGVMLPVQNFAGFTMTYVFHNGKDGDGTNLDKTFTYDWTPSSTTALVAGQILKFDIQFTLNEIIVSPTLTDWTTQSTTTIELPQ